jgi:hypothetical protein
VTKTKPITRAVNVSSLISRLNRRLEKDNRRVLAPRGRRGEDHAWFIVDTISNEIVEENVTLAKLEQMGHKHKCIRPWEVLTR